MKLLQENIISLMILSVNLLATISYFVIYSNNKFKNSFFKLPKILQKIYVVFFVAPLFISPFFAVTKIFEFNIFFMVTGFTFSIIGIVIIIMSFFKIGIIPSIKSDGKLSTTGTYKIVRHPIYFGTILTQTGFILINQTLIPAIYLPFSIILYFIMATIEEKDLIEIFGDDYKNFKLKTRCKVLPFIL